MTILGGVTIGDGAVIGAKVVVTKDIPPYAIAAGNPARVTKYRFGPEKIKYLQEVQWWDLPLDELERRLPEISRFGDSENHKIIWLRSSGLERQDSRDMGKIGIINHWMVNNYGALFLAYALEKKLLDLGYDVETISWLPDEVKKPWQPSMIKKTGFMHYFLRLGYFLTFVLPREKSFAHFRSLMHTSQTMYSDATLPEIATQYEKIIVGGDQLWNCKINYYNPNNFLPFIHEKNRKIVYAASLAQDSMREGFEAEFCKLASGFGYITTRERRGKEIIEDITGLSAPRVVDPAFFLTASEWEKLAVLPKEREKYLFVYQVQSDAVVAQFAHKIAKSKGLKVVYCPFPLKTLIKCRCKPYMSPEKWLGYVKNAEYIVTDAYHGLVFSLIFNKQFAVEISEYGKDTHSRITNLLELLSLTDRLFSKENEIDIDRKIDYNAINAFIAKDRQQSIEHIHKMLEI